jgi:predicted signal transduction protein with EAL and GGDEF domain
MNRSKIVAIVTGAISILLAIAYLILVQLLDYRDMQPAPISQVTSQQTQIATIYTLHSENHTSNITESTCV